MSTSPPERLQKPNDNHTLWILRRVWDRVNDANEHFMSCIVGREGSGKSYTAIKIAGMVDPSFNADRIIFDVTELLRVLENGDHEPGQFYVLDEAGVQLGNRTWQDRAQILANQALQLIRSHNLGLIFTLPRLSELDSQAEGRLQNLVEVVDKVPDEYVKVKWKWMDPDRTDNNGEIYKKYPRRREHGYEKRITRNKFAPPADEELVEEYEQRKSVFQREMYERTIDALTDDEEEEEAEQLSVKDVATLIVDDGIEAVVSEHGNTGDPYINHQLIRAQYDVSHDDAKAIKSLLDKQITLDKSML
jgi:adenylate kinase family enzyme